MIKGQTLANLSWAFILLLQNNLRKTKSLNTNNQKCKKETGTNGQTNTDTLDPYDLSQGDWDEVPNENQTRIN